MHREKDNFTKYGSIENGMLLQASFKRKSIGTHRTKSVAAYIHC